MAIREGAEAALSRWRKLQYLQKIYSEFGAFLDVAMEHLGFDVTEVQQDIGSFMAYGPQYSMVQAQRGQAKTTIAAIFAVWSLIHDPAFRVLVLSAGGTQANEISTLIVRLLMTLPELECLRPDASNGDRTSVEAFDVHYTLKGVDKSPSVACVGVTGNMQGKRADLLIPDDIESSKNSRTATMRELLLDLTRDFTSICETGRILYLGTPQTQDSIYLTLPSRGFTIRVWPGRYPTSAQAVKYGDMLAPFVINRLKMNPGLAFGGGLLGDQGQPIDSRLNEQVLRSKELDQGTTYFQLQHMLNTALSDEMRYPLKTRHLVMMRLPGPDKHFPVTVTRSYSDDGLKDVSVHGAAYKVSTVHEVSSEVSKLQGIVMYVDPAGGGKNGDETAYAVTGFLNGNIFLLSSGGVPGGYNIEQMEYLADLAAKWQVNRVIIEQNMGYGAFRNVWLPILRQKHECAVDDDYVTGQKELRIAETLEPVMSRGSLIVSEDVVEEDRGTSAIHEPAKRKLCTLFHQMSRLTRDRDCLAHDDRIDALEGAVRYWVKQLSINQQHAIDRAREREHAEAIKNPFNRDKHDFRPARMSSLFNRYRK